MPTRYLKPGICDSASFEAIKLPISETLYYRLLVNVDDFGRMDARASLIKSYCFPLKEKLTSDSVQKMLADLQQAGLIILYQADGKEYLQLTKWDNVPRAKVSKCPDVPTDVYSCIQNPTNLPVTGTGTGTKTGTKTETETGTKLAAREALKPDEVSDNTWNDFLVTRKSHKALLTETALDGIKSEANKAGWTLEAALKKCCERNWRSFDSTWVNKPTDNYRQNNFNQPQAQSKTMQGIMLLQDEIDRINREE
jgi:hypothetical protein